MVTDKSLKKLIYLIDDDHISNYITTKIIDKQPFEKLIKTFENGRIAFNELINIKWDYLSEEFDEIIIFLDINMPVMNGWEFLNACVDNHLNTLVPIRLVMLTSSIDQNDRNLSKDYKMVKEFIIKPLTPKKLENAFPDLPISDSNS